MKYIIAILIVLAIVPMTSAQDRCASQQPFVDSLDTNMRPVVEQLIDAANDANFRNLRDFAGVISMATITVRQYVTCDRLVERIEEYERLAYYALLITSIDDSYVLTETVQDLPDVDVIEFIALAIVDSYSNIIFSLTYRSS